MKKTVKIISLILCFTLLSAFPAYAARKAGDVDGDGRITASDARKALRASVNLEKLSYYERQAADIDGTGGVTASDAREILRISVGLGGGSATLNNEYDILRSGTFSFSGRMPDADNRISRIEGAYTPTTTYALSSIDGTNVAVLITANNAYFVSHEKRCYIKLTDAILKPMGMSFQQLKENADFGFDGFRPLSQADSKTNRNVNGYSCIVYKFNYSDGKKEVAMCGNKLVQISYFSKSGVMQNWIIFDSVSASVPSSMKQVPSGYRRYLTLIPFFAAIQ